MDTVRYEDLGRGRPVWGYCRRPGHPGSRRGIFLCPVNLICLVHPRLIVLGGNSVSLGSVFLEEIRRSLSETGFARMTENVNCVTASWFYACYNGAMKYFF